MPLQFNEYLKSCREKYKLTQEELVGELYNFDDTFKGLDIGTYSRWERGVTRPNSNKQIGILKLLQTKSNHILSCFENLDKEAIENELCKLAIKNLIGSSKEHILNFPTKLFKVDYVSVQQIKNTDDIDKILAMPYSVILNLTDNVYDLSLELIKEWALHPSNLFLLSEYHNQFSGMLFTLRLKPKIFQKVIDFELELKELTSDDFATFDEMACNFPIAFFAHNDKNSSLLILRYYAHIIANQDVIQSLGAIPLLDGAKKIVQKMNMKYYKEKEVTQGMLVSYQAPLSDVLLNEAVLKMIFQKQDCPESD